MRTVRWIALGVLVGLVAATGTGGLTAARAQMNGPSPAEAQAALQREKALLDQAQMQWQQTNSEMMSTMQMQMTPAEKAMMKEMQEMHKEIKMLMQMNQDLSNAVSNMGGPHN